jgi:hypothetical protein
LFEALVARFVCLVTDGETINDMHTRLIVNQSISMADAAIRDGRRTAADSKIIEIAPRALHPYLDYSVGSFFARAKDGDRITAALYDGGVNRIGELAERPQEEIERMIGHPELLATVKRELADVRLGLGMRVPRWRQDKKLA